MFCLAAFNSSSFGPSSMNRLSRITSYNVCYTKLLRGLIGSDWNQNHIGREDRIRDQLSPMGWTIEKDKGLVGTLSFGHLLQHLGTGHAIALFFFDLPQVSPGGDQLQEIPCTDADRCQRGAIQQHPIDPLGGCPEDPISRRQQTGRIEVDHRHPLPGKRQRSYNFV